MARVTYVGHATVLIDLDGVRLITDPVLRPRVLHLRRVGSVPAAALRGLDAVLLSHAHWDHMDLPSLERLGKELPIVCPKGLAALLRRKRFAHVTTLEEGEEVRSARSPCERFTPSTTEAAARWGPPASSASSSTARRPCISRVTPICSTALSELGAVDLALIPVAGWGSKVGAGASRPRARG